MAKRRRTKMLDADLDLEMDDYEPSDLDDDYDENEKVLLKQVGQRNTMFDEDNEDSEEEVFKIHSSDDDDHEEVERNDVDMNSDIEDGGNDVGNILSSKAWGTNRKNFYHTDYVDQDYGGFSKAEEEEAALQEEQEARAIQDRLVAELEDTDLTLGLFTKVEEGHHKKVAEADIDEVIKTDLSKLSKREKLTLLEKESPEFMGLINDFKERFAYARDKLEPILNMANCGELPMCPAIKFVKTKYLLTLNYGTNIAFYLLLKAEHISIKAHPVVKRLFQYRKWLEQMDTVDSQIIAPQVDAILQRQSGTSTVIDRRETKKMLKLLSPRKTDKKEAETETPVATEEEAVVEDIVEEENPVTESDAKRAITFQIAKNKGLTPRRKKEQRNPRVKNRNKYRKAKINRKGQVRDVRKEISRYGGEVFGIKASVSKSVKLK